jgi:hypothetical protein
MRTFYAVLVLGVVASSFGRAGAAGFADGICPQATQYVIAAGKLRQDDPPQRVYEAAQAVTDAYAQCSKEKLSSGFREPQHYADTRAAAFAVLAARALVAMDRLDEARSELQHWRPLAQQVVDWKGETSAYQSADPNGYAVTVGADNRTSLYRASAKEIVAAMDTELAAIDRRTHDVARPQAQQPSPGPAASP